MPAKKKQPADLGGGGMYPPHLEDLPGQETRGAGERVPYAEVLRSICGATDDSQEVEQYDGTLGVTVAFVNAHERPVVQVQWNSDLAATFTQYLQAHPPDDAALFTFAAEQNADDPAYVRALRETHDFAQRWFSQITPGQFGVLHITF